MSAGLTPSAVFGVPRSFFESRLTRRARVKTPGKGIMSGFYTLRLQIAQSRSYLSTLGPKVGIICIEGAPRIGSSVQGYKSLHKAF